MTNIITSAADRRLYIQVKFIPISSQKKTVVILNQEKNRKVLFRQKSKDRV